MNTPLRTRLGIAPIPVPITRPAERVVIPVSPWVRRAQERALPAKEMTR